MELTTLFVFTFVNNLPFSVIFRLFLSYSRLLIDKIGSISGFRIYYVK